MPGSIHAGTGGYPNKHFSMNRGRSQKFEKYDCFSTAFGRVPAYSGMSGINGKTEMGYGFAKK